MIQRFGMGMSIFNKCDFSYKKRLNNNNSVAMYCIQLGWIMFYVSWDFDSVERSWKDDGYGS